MNIKRFAVCCSFMQATIRGLEGSQQPCVRISGVRAVCGFCDHLTGNFRAMITSSLCHARTVTGTGVFIQ